MLKKMKILAGSEMRPCEKVNKFKVTTSVVIIALLFALFTFYYDLSVNMWRVSRFYGKMSGPVYPSVTSKKILFWNTMFGDETFYFGKGDIFKNCPGVSSKCLATHDRTLVNVEDFDALLFHGSELNSVQDVPKLRREQQRYVFVNLESPENRPILFDEFDYNYFNLTMTYRLDSDIFWSYADIRELRNGRLVVLNDNDFQSPRLDEKTGPQSSEQPSVVSEGKNKSTGRSKTLSTKNKTKTAVWFVSNCHTKSKREKYIDELARHVDVDIFGLCNQNDGCPRDQDCFRKVVEPNYYFYLSFENSMCQDYVTEKLYNALKYDVVPVVYGGANYSRFAPPKSYINTLDFDSPKKLAEYLQRLIREPREYEKYFEWKQRYEIVQSNHRVICQLCQYLHENNTSRFYSSLSAWYTSGKCPFQEKLQYVPYLTNQDLKNR